MIDCSMNTGSTYSAHFIQIIFSVYKREPLLSPDWENELYKYIAGIINNRNNKIIAINGMPDHVHILLKLAPTECVSDLVREIKKSTSLFIRRKLRFGSVFYWQRGYAVISYNEKDIPTIKNYIQKQKQHHAQNKRRL